MEQNAHHFTGIYYIKSREIMECLKLMKDVHPTKYNGASTKKKYNEL